MFIVSTFSSFTQVQRETFIRARNLTAREELRIARSNLDTVKLPRGIRRSNVSEIFVTYRARSFKARQSWFAEPRGSVHPLAKCNRGSRSSVKLSSRQRAEERHCRNPNISLHERHCRILEYLQLDRFCIRRNEGNRRRFETKRKSNICNVIM